MSSNSTDQNSELQARFAEVFARLPEQDIEQFYAHYQLWLLRRRVPLIEKQLEFLHEHLRENQHLIASLRPSVIALAVLVRLQSSGVSDIDVLDQMLERGEDWLDRMMQRLDYCEQVEDFIQGDYTQWCVRSLEGAYDWIDTVLGLGAPTAEQEISYTGAPDVSALEATEELLLQKLTLDDEGEMLETTLKQPAIETDRAQQNEREIETQPGIVPEEQPIAASGELEMSIPQPQPAAYDEIEVNIAEEFLLVRESTIETQASVAEGEEAVEIVDWEGLERPELRPEPWYSVNLAADAAPNAQPDMMHDWINVLQADAPRTESSTSEVTEVNAEALPTPAEDAPQAANVTPIPAEVNAEEVVAQAAPGDLAETPSVEEVQHEPEMSAETEVTPVVAEVQEEPEASLESAATALVAEVELAESADTVTVDDIEAVEAEREVELPIDESAAISEDVEQEAEEVSVESAGDVVEAEAAEQKSVAVETSEQSSAEVVPTETPEAQSAEVDIVEQPGDRAEPSEQATIEDQSAVNGAAPLARAEEQPVENTVEEQEIPLTPIFVSDGSSETVEEVATLPETGEADLAGREVEQTQKTEAVSWNYLPADETLFSAESNARPWYEYLAQDEQVAQMSQNWGETEEATEVEAVPAESTLQVELERLERERTEGQGWEMFPEIDATQPMVALKGKQRMRKTPQPTEPAIPANDVEEQHVVADEFVATDKPGEVSGAEQVEPAANELSEMPVALIRDEMRSIQHEMQSIQNKVMSIQHEISEASPVPPVLVAVPRVIEEPEKVGFWRRLFGWMRKK